MALVSLIETSETHLPSIENIDGQLIFCKDTSNLFKDNGVTRQLMSSELVICDELPLAPISNKLYLVLPNSLYVYNNEWLKINKTPIVLVDSYATLPFSGDMGKIYIDTSDNCVYYWNENLERYFCVGNGSSDERNIEVIHGGRAF